MSGLLNILRNKIFRRWFKAFFISAKSAETKSSECDLSSREGLSGILPLLSAWDRHSGKTGLGKKTGFSLWWSIFVLSSSEGPFGAVWEEQLDDAQHPGDLGSHPRLCPGLVHPWISAGSTSSSHSGPGTAGPGQPNKSIL